MYSGSGATSSLGTGLSVGGVAVAVGQIDVGINSILTPSAGSSDSSITWNSTTGKVYANTIASTCLQYRVVSAAVQGMYLGTEFNLSGKFIPFFIPATAVLSGLASAALPGNAGAAEVFTYSDSLPIQSNRRFCTSRWLPQDSNSLNYTVPGALGTTGTNGSFRGWIGFIIVGCPNATPFEWCLKENLEFVPLNSVVNLIQTSASPSDPIEMAVASNALSRSADAATMQPNKPLTMNKESGHEVVPSKGSDSATLFEKVLSGVDKLSDVGGKVASTVGPLLAML
jgi:hypothetical protein